MSRIRLLALTLIAVLTVAEGLAAEPVKSDLFRAGTDGYVHYRIPGVVVTPANTVLAYCEARKDASGDWGAIDILLRRGEHGGDRWSDPVRLGETPLNHAKNLAAVTKKLAKTDAVTFNNPVAVVDRDRETIHFVYCVEYARCFHMTSTDDGKTWSKPVEITQAFEQLRPVYDWKVLATGPGHGIQLQNGRLLIPIWLSTGTGGHAHRPSCVATLFSDDHGTSWHTGEVVVAHPTIGNPSETVAAELADGRVLLNIRNDASKHRRAVSISSDGSSDWSEPRYVEELYEPVCMGSLLAIPQRESTRLLYAGPHSRETEGAKKGKRERLTLWFSPNAGETWPDSRVLEPGIAAYSDLARGLDDTVYCFYERSPDSQKEYQVDRLTLAKFPLEWVRE